MTVFVRPTTPSGKGDKQAAGGDNKPEPQPVGEWVGGVWVGK